MILRYKKAFPGIVVLLAFAQLQNSQNVPTVATVLRNISSKVPEFKDLVNVQPGVDLSRNSWNARYQDYTIRVDVTMSTKHAEWSLEQSLLATSVSHDRKEVFLDRPLYIWDRYGGRLSYQTGIYVIHINGRDEAVAKRLLESLVRELESVAPPREIRRTRDFPMNHPFVNSWGPQQEEFREGNFEIVSWDDAMFLLINRDLQGGKQYHTRWLTIFSTNGEKFLTLESKLDDYMVVAKARNLKLDGFASE
jgi:hypothetical protein